MISEPLAYPASSAAEGMSIDSAALRTWDAVVVGAGPAGAVAAALLAARGWRVLLLERSRWPRDKVCGGCLSHAAVERLRAIGLGDAPYRAVPLRASVFHNGAQHPTTVPLPGGVAISRRDLDGALVTAFVDRGGHFISGAAVTLSPETGRSATRSLIVNKEGASSVVRARVVLACDGISGSTLAGEPWAAWQVRPGSLIGFSATAPAMDVNAGDIHMNVGACGYVGATRFADGSVHLAAALDPLAARSLGGPAEGVRAILKCCGWANMDLWSPQRGQGSARLTRHRTNLAGHRVMAVGDACGYVEPFTGEGMAWAIEGACRATELLRDPIDWPTELPDRWKRLHAATVGRQQHRCRLVRRVVREPLLTHVTLGALRRMPWLAKLVTHAPSSHDGGSP